MARPCSFFFLAVLACIVHGTAGQALKTLVPLYMAPTVSASNVCNQVGWVSVGNASAKAVGIVNVANGPGTAVNSVYTTCLNYLKTRSVTLIGYVSTKNTTLSGGVYTQTGMRPIASIQLDIQRWKTFYGLYISGIFIDEVSAVNQPTLFGVDQVAFYKSVISTVCNNTFGSSAWTTVGNPGGQTLSQLMDPASSAYFNVTVIFERQLIGIATPYKFGGFWPPTGSINCLPALWTAANGAYPPGPYCPYVACYDAIEAGKALVDAGLAQSAVLIYAANVTTPQLTQILDTCRVNRVTHVYLSSLALNPNPWASLPSYFKTMVSLL